MILLVADSRDREAAEIVETALRRSFTGRQVARVTSAELPARADDCCAVMLNPDAQEAAWVARMLADTASSRAKILLLGYLPPPIADVLGVDAGAPVPQGIGPASARWSDCPSAAPHRSSASPARIAYTDRGFGLLSPLRSRHLQRFDFADEWNNLGYGRITLDGGPWSLCQTARVTEATSVAELTVEGQPDRVAYAALRDLPTAALLWFNRQVGPVDSQEWRLVEIFFSDYRAETLPCRPHLREIPLGYDSAVTMRLDCDEAIASARPLFELYQSFGLPLSLAVTTALLDGPEASPTSGTDDLRLLRDVIAAGGSVLSHSHSHPVGWGGSGEAALTEAVRSKAALTANLPGEKIRYSVSPFHQMPHYAVMALARAGYDGVIGGSIATEPQHLVGRAGCLPFGDRRFISHSQQCMLHGDCVAEQSEPLAIYQQAFAGARQGHSIFGYLDHPFSPRYSYGWTDEVARLASHTALLRCFQAEGGRLLFLSENDCLDFIAMKSACEIVWSPDFNRFVVEGVGGKFALAVGYRGRWHAADAAIDRDCPGGP